MRRLRDSRVIEGDVSITDPQAVGRPLSMLVFVFLERERRDINGRLKH